MKVAHYVAGAAAVLVSGCVIAQPRLPGQISDSANTMFTVKVVDEDGKPLPDMLVIGNMLKTSARGLEYGRREKMEQKTDRDGNAVFEGRSVGSWGAVVMNPGYYNSGTKPQRAERKEGLLRDRWLPWNPTYVVMARKILNPVPMYADGKGRGFEKFEPPVQGQPVGYDLIARDWVIPHGKGTHRDFIFEVQKTGGDYRDAFDVRMKLTFANAGDGIQVARIPSKEESDSIFRWPREAPEHGYQPVLGRFMRRESPDKMWTSDAGRASAFFFRVRSVADSTGNVKEAMYGKILDDIEVDWTGGISFLYYLNPDKSRNMEFDPSKNLFKDHPSRSLEP